MWVFPRLLVLDEVLRLPHLPDVMVERTDTRPQGIDPNGIGSSLGISVETVKTHVGNAMDKLGARDRTQMAVMALLYGLIDPLQ